MICWSELLAMPSAVSQARVVEISIEFRLNVMEISIEFSSLITAILEGNAAWWTLITYGDRYR